MQVSQVMHKGLSTAQINDSIKKVAALMKREDIGAVPVFKNERPVGLVTDRDIILSCIAEGHPTDDPISHAMTKDIISVHEKDDLELAANLMRKHQVSRLMVVDEGNTPVGMVSLQDISRLGNNDKLTSSVIHEIKR